MTSSEPDSRSPGRKQRFLLRIERLSRKNWRAVFLVTLLVVVLATWLGSKLELESDILRLIPEGNRKVDTFREALLDFGSIDLLLVLVEAGEGEGPEELEDFADYLAESLQEREDLIEFVEYRFEPDEALLELLYENALLFLPPDRLPELAEKLESAKIRQELQEYWLDQHSPTSMVMAELRESDPLRLMPLFLNRILGSRGALDVDLSDGYYLSKDNKTLIMLVKPTSPSQNIDFDGELMETVRSLEQEIRLELREEGADPQFRVGYGGNYAMALQETGMIREDASRNLWISLIAVSGLYWLCYRRFAALLYSSIPLLVGQAMTFGLAYFALHQLNAASSAFTALLMGLGTDFTIVMYARYVEERQKGRTLAEATETMVGETGLGVFTGAITSAGTFFAMCISQFRGLFDLGFLIGSGILLCAIAIVFLLPAMITWNESVRKRKVESIKKLHLQSFGLERLIPFSARHKKLVIVTTVILTVAGAWLGTLLLLHDFNDSMNSLRSNRTEAAAVQAEIAETFGASLSYMMAIAEGEDLEEAVGLTVKIQERLEPFMEDGTIGSFDSILTYIPPEEQQQEILDSVRAGGDAFDPERIRIAFHQGLAETGFRDDAFDEFLVRMEKFLAPAHPVNLDDLTGRGLERLVDRYVHARDGKTRIVTYLFPTDPRWRREPPPGLTEALAGDDDGIVVTGTNVVAQELRNIFLKEAPRAVLAGLVIVLVLLLLDFRSLRLSLIAMAQLICGVVMMLGVMKIARIELNYVNAFVTVMILGVGIDYSIHLVHRLHWTNGKIEPGLLETGKAVVMAALTNIAGFGTLMLCSYPALRSFGTVALIGSLTCLFTSLTLVPALMARESDSQG